MIKNRLPIFLAAAVVCSPVLAQSPADKPLSESDLLKQIETLKPDKNAPPLSPPPEANLLLNSSGRPTNTILQPGGPTMIGSGVAKPNPANPADPADPNAKPPTEITALEATFDQHANVAVFIGNVIVKDPQFNVVCDKMTAYLKHDEKPAPGAPLPKGATPKPVTPKPATPASGTPAPGATPAAKKGGLDKAIAVTTSSRRVVITQDKVEADGSITHGIGISDRAEYFATTGDIFLYGTPDVTQGTNRCIATAPETVMTLNRDGHMTAKGPHKTIIVDNTDPKATPTPK